MKKLFVALIVLACLLCGAALAENEYYTVETTVDIVSGDVYTAVVNAGEEGWEWSISENKDITSWLVKEDGTAAFTDESGVATAHLIYGPIDGEEEDCAVTLEVVIDMSKVTGFTEDEAYDLYFMPQGKDAIWAAGNNHGQYVDCMEYLGTVNIPSITVEGEITGESVMSTELTTNTAEIILSIDDFDASLVDTSEVEIVILEGSGYYTYDFEVVATLEDDWTDGTCTVTVESLEGSFGMQGGDGNGHYDIHIGVTGLKYNGLALPDITIHTDIYAYGRTFLSDNGSLIWYSEPEWDSEEEITIIGDIYPDTFTVTWPVGMDASALTVDDVTITLVSEYDDELVLTAGEDYTINAASYETEIVLTYIYWPYAPVYSQLRVDIATDNVVRDETMYADTAVFSHSYDIASVSVYSEMSSDGDTQYWTIYGFANLTDASQIFKEATYTLTMTDEDGNVWFYGEDEDGNGVLVDAEADAVVYNCDEECNVTLIDQKVAYTRLYDQVETKTVDGEEIEFEKLYVKCEVLLRDIDDLDESLELLPGYYLGDSWEDHLKWPWQSFINIGYMSDND